MGIAVKNKAGEYELLTGNQTGMLLLDYICSQRVKHGKMPADPVMVKTIVTMDMGEQIATHYGLRTINVLTGFKFIGEQIGKLEKQGKADSYVFGFEESYGYLTGSYVRDKDGVDGAYMICEMFSYYATKGISLLDKLDELYKTYGYCLNTLHSYEFDGSAGFAKMQSIMQVFRGDIKEFGGKKVVKLLDYAPVWMACPSPMCSSFCWKVIAPLWCAPPVPNRSSRPIFPSVRRIRQLPRRWKQRFVRVLKST